MSNIYIIFVKRVVGWYLSFILKFDKEILYANRGDPDQTPNSVPFDLGLQCSPMSHRRDAMLIRVKVDSIFS